MFRRGLFYAYLSIYLRHQLGLSVTETTLFATLPMVVNVLAQTVVWGKISDRFQLRRTLIIVGEVSAAFSTVLIWYLHRRFVDPTAAGYTIILGLTIVEIFWSMSNISWSALVSDIYDAKQRSRIQGRLTSMGGAGTHRRHLDRRSALRRHGAAFCRMGILRGAFVFRGCRGYAVLYAAALFSSGRRDKTQPPVF